MTVHEQLKRILFVDDEPHLLAGLKRSLRPLRREWDMSFAGSGEEALQLAELSDFDAIVTDMRMPGMDGAELLGAVARCRPRTVRIVLSGYSDKESDSRLVEIAHRFVAKPCDPDVLKAVLRRSLALQTLLADAELQAIASSLGSLPTLPSVYQRITRMLQSPGATVRGVGELIGEDPPTSAKLLQVVNSAFFGVGRRVSNPEEAATLLGMEALKGLVLVTGVFHQFESSPSAASTAALEHLWPHSLSVGRLARDIAARQSAEKTVVEDATTSGLMHNIGMVLLAARSPSSWEDVQELVANGDIPRWEATRQVTGVSHNVLGAYLLGLWGLPEPVVEAVAFYHQPSRQAGESFSALTAVHVADALIHDNGHLDEDYLSTLGLSDGIPDWRALAASLAGDTDR